MDNNRFPSRQTQVEVAFFFAQVGWLIANNAPANEYAFLFTLLAIELAVWHFVLDSPDR